MLKDLDYMNANPDWRANISIFNSNTSSSYQGEYPGEFWIERSLQLVVPNVTKECTKLFLFSKFQSNPIVEPFLLEVYDNYKNKLDEITFYTNTINIFKLENLKNNLNENMLIFISRKQGGVPIYLSKSLDDKSISLEHTHPPVEYLYWGERNFFQKNKKIFWFNSEK